ncbi:aminopeptidase [Xanthovirga aplysinae]|uniref:aminopeptidase n=1 Tax=Xanthovirga aplysinae TaxID=2529853 RepID=UPI0012BD2E42|nr:aminopeptidase [Xanthovirga aplysinae]MTI33409.1 aminopeptidase [Xanthovirga aplysinae]
MLKKLLLSSGVLFLLLILWQHKLIIYGYGQAKGQLNIIMNARPVNEFIEKEDFPDSLKQKLLLIQEIRKFAIDSLGINDSDNYTTLFDQKNKPILWVVTASEPFALKAKEWWFPFLGSVSYKGYFDREKARKEQSKLVEQGYDTSVGTVSGWSTLGWFKDPILSNMLNNKEGDLANLIIHELTHGTLFVKDQVAFNENLATFIGDKGAESFLTYKYGRNSNAYKEYEDAKADREKFSTYILSGAQKLDSLYNSLRPEQSDSLKLEKKEGLIRDIVKNADTLSFRSEGSYVWFFDDFQPNNAFFMSYLRYRSKQGNFEEEFQNQFEGNLKNYLEYLKKKYPSI